MKLIDLTCTKCGAQLKVNADLKKCMCQYCRNEMLIDDETIHHNLDNGFDFGYQAELGRIQAQQDIERQQEINRQNMIIADRQRLLNTPRGREYWQCMSNSLRRPVNDIEAEQYIRKMLLTDRMLAYQYQNGIHCSQEQTVAEKQLSDDEYNKLYFISKFAAIISIIPLISIIIGTVLLCKIFPVKNTNKLKTRIMGISSIAILICTISTGIFFVITNQDSNTAEQQSQSITMNNDISDTMYDLNNTTNIDELIEGEPDTERNTYNNVYEYTITFNTKEEYSYNIIDLSVDEPKIELVERKSYDGFIEHWAILPAGTYEVTLADVEKNCQADYKANVEVLDNKFYGWEVGTNKQTSESWTIQDCPDDNNKYYYDTDWNDNNKQYWIYDDKYTWNSIDPNIGYVAKATVEVNEGQIVYIDVNSSGYAYTEWHKLK